MDFLHTNNIVSQLALAIGLGAICMYHGENFRKMTQYGRLGGIF